MRHFMEDLIEVQEMTSIWLYRLMEYANSCILLMSCVSQDRSFGSHVG